MLNPKTWIILERCVEEGMEAGWNHAHEHYDSPTMEQIFQSIEQYILLNIDQYFEIHRPFDTQTP